MRIHAGPLETLISEVFIAAGCSDAESARIGQRLVRANMTGHDSHGVIRTQRYVEWLAAGTQVADREVEVVLDTDVYAILDGQYGMGQTVGEQAVQIGIGKAKTHGVSIIALRHAGHLGRIGDWAEMAADEGIVSIHFVNVRGGALVAPFGGAEKRFGTNPVTIGVPQGPESDHHLILDFATSIVAEGKAYVSLLGGPPLPANALVDGDGRMTNDPVALYGEVAPGELPNARNGAGGLRAMGDHKGSGLAFMCEILAGALTGSRPTGPEARRFCNGMLSIYLDIETFDTEHTFAADVLDFVEWMKETRTAEGHDEILVPGEPELRRSRHRAEHGLELPDGTWESISGAALSVGLVAERINRDVFA
jgi:uncharacterized oxidoreductase